MVSYGRGPGFSGSRVTHPPVLALLTLSSLQRAFLGGDPGRPEDLDPVLGGELSHRGHIGRCRRGRRDLELGGGL